MSAPQDQPTSTELETPSTTSPAITAKKGKLKVRQNKSDPGFLHALKTCRAFGQDITRIMLVCIKDLADSALINHDGKACAPCSKEQKFLTYKEYMAIYDGIQTMRNANDVYEFRNNRSPALIIKHAYFLQNSLFIETVFLKEMREDEIWTEFDAELSNGKMRVSNEDGPASDVEIFVSDQNLNDAISQFVKSAYEISSVERGMNALKTKEQSLKRLRTIVKHFVSLKGSLEEMVEATRDLFPKEEEEKEKESDLIVQNIVEKIRASKSLLRVKSKREPIVDAMIISAEMRTLEVSKRTAVLIERGHIIHG